MENAVRAQVTIYIILGIFLFVVVFLLALISFRSVGGPVEMNSDSVHDYLDGRIEDLARGCVWAAGNIGFSTNRDDFDLDNSIRKFKMDAEDCMEVKLEDLARNGEVRNKFPVLDIKEEGRIDADVEANGELVFNIIYPVIIGKENDSVSFSEFEVVFDFNLSNSYTVFNEVITNFDRCGDFSNGDVEVTLSDSEDGTHIDIDFGGDFVLNGNLVWELRDYFKLSRNKMVVMYQDNELLPTFGGKAREILEDNLELDYSNVRYLNCEESASFLDNEEIEEKDIIVITGNMQYQIVDHDSDAFLRGCNVFNDPDRGNDRRTLLKNWIENGGRLWINDVSKYESDGYGGSYFGSLGYRGGAWDEEILPDGEVDQQEDIIGRTAGRASSVEEEDITFLNHQIFNCPNPIEDKIVGVWIDDTLEVTSEDEIILGDKSEAILWIRKLGSGFIVFDEFLLKDNLLNGADFGEDLVDKEIGDEYYENVLIYLLKPETKDEK